MIVNKLKRKVLLEMIEDDSGAEQLHVIKFYSEGCPMCHALREYYIDLASDIPGVNFHLFNMKAGANLEKQMGFRGVPTIAFIKTGPQSRTAIMPEPDNPNRRTWYRVSDIKEFIRRQLQQ